MASSVILTLKKPVIGMVHLPPLPGSSRYAGESLVNLVHFAVEEAKALCKGGVDAVLVENFNDFPYAINNVPTTTLISMAVITYAIKEKINKPVGVNILFNDFENELYLAFVLELDFIRVEGFIDLLFSDLGPLVPAAPQLMRLRRLLGAERVAILADVQGKYTHPFPPRDIFESARDALERGGADAIILTGARTGQAADLNMVRNLKEKVPGARVFLGSGITPSNVAELLAVADGAIVGSYFKKDGKVWNRVDPKRVEELMVIVEKLRKEEK